eukprot:gb/GECH01012266.1/.p1 GENE.gb/GECH01012266.1/~~gb/GECH01012266.1/.p1  ORF type:complete len:909 (+),score=248.26 gb/GECH01012266.1/:1-2727(+)
MATTNFIVKAETVLEKAEVLENAGNKSEAFQVLQEIATSKRSKYYSKSIESIMLKFVELCVEFRESRIAKEGLLQFKNVCSPPARELWTHWKANASAPNVASLFQVVTKFLTAAEARVKEAQEKSDQIHLDMLELDSSEEQIEASMVNAIQGQMQGQDLKGRTEREHFTPWLLYLRDCYRCCIDVLRNNPFLEEGYHSVVSAAFDFCKQYHFRSEFRRLCEIIRTHLSSSLRYAPSYLKNETVFEYYMGTRLKQLQVASDLDLWQEAYRTVEDVSTLMEFHQKTPSPKLLVRYLELMSRIFWHSQNYLFHAYSMARYLALSKIQEPKMEKQKLQEISSKVLVAVLCVPDEKRTDDYGKDSSYNRQIKLAALMKAAVPPARRDLIFEIESKKVFKAVYPELSELFDIMEREINPSRVTKRIKPIFEFIEKSETLSPYLPQLRQAVLFRVLQLMSQVYEVAKLSDLYSMFPYFTPVEIERRVIQAVSTNMLYVTIDHVKGVLHFNDPNAFESILRDELSRVAKGINQAVKVIKPQIEKGQREYKAQFFNEIMGLVDQENEELRNRKDVISKRQKEKESWVEKEKELAEETEKKRQERKTTQQHQELEKEKERIEAQQRQKEKQQQHIANLVEILDELAKTENVDVQKMKNKVKSNVSYAMSVHKESMVQQLLEEKQKRQQRIEKETMDKLIKSHAHFQALRDKEASRVDKVHKAENKDQKQHHEKVVKEAKERRKQKLEEAKQQKEVYETIAPHIEQLRDSLLQSRREKHEKQLAEYNERKEEARAKWQEEKEEWEKEKAAYKPPTRSAEPAAASSEPSAWRPSRKTSEPREGVWRPRSRRGEAPASAPRERREEPKGGAWRPGSRRGEEPPRSNSRRSEEPKEGAWRSSSQRNSSSSGGSRWRPPHKRA